MCRYAEYGPYKEPFACFTCRKVFKQANRRELPEHRRPTPGRERVCWCPQCGRPMADMGRDFKAPPVSAVDQWRKVEILFNHGFTYHSCGCCGPGLRPDELRDVRAFLDDALPRTDGERLLPTIERNARRRQQRNAGDTTYR